MMRKYTYLFLAVIGLMLPYYFLISFLVAHGLDVHLFFWQLFGTPISSFFAVDLILSGVVFVLFLGREAARLQMKCQWVYLIALFTVGLSFALPLFLFVREQYQNRER